MKREVSRLYSCRLIERSRVAGDTLILRYDLLERAIDIPRSLKGRRKQRSTDRFNFF